MGRAEQSKLNTQIPSRANPSHGEGRASTGPWLGAQLQTTLPPVTAPSWKQTLPDFILYVEACIVASLLWLGSVAFGSNDSLMALASSWSPPSHSWKAQCVAGLTIYNSGGRALVMEAGHLCWRQGTLGGPACGRYHHSQLWRRGTCAEHSINTFWDALTASSSRARKAFPCPEQQREAQCVWWLHSSWLRSFHL